MSKSVGPELTAAIDKVSNHLEFHGYEMAADSENPQHMFAVHPERPNIMVRVFPRGVQFTSFFYSNELAKQHRLGFLEMVNELNLNSTLVQYSADNEGALVIDSLWVGVYDKVIFGQFLDLWHDDIDKMRSTEGVQRFFS